jgi:hypothetical protein
MLNMSNWIHNDSNWIYLDLINFFDNIKLDIKLDIKRMSNIILGELARRNHGLREKYPTNTPTAYKQYIDQIEKQMMISVYDKNNVSDCIITKVCPISAEDLLLKNNGSPDYAYINIEPVLINFCKLHNSSISILRLDTDISVTIDMKMPFNVNYV